MSDTIERGTHAGTAPGERIDPLELLAEVSKEFCGSIISHYESRAYAQDLPEWRRLRQVQKLLTLNARHVPSVVDEVIDIARAHGGLKV